jgi:hypothetical protein
MPRFSFKRDHEKSLKSSVVSQFFRLCSHPRGRPVVRHGPHGPGRLQLPSQQAVGATTKRTSDFLSHCAAFHVERAANAHSLLKLGNSTQRAIF